MTGVQTCALPISCLNWAVVSGVADVSAWEMEAHQGIARHAVSTLPEPLRGALETQLVALLHAVIEPDINRVDDHRLVLTIIRGTPPQSGGAWALERFAKQAERFIREGRDITDPAVIMALGQAAHFAQDLNVPLHTTWGEGPVHQAYEAVAYFNDWPGTGGGYGYRGFHLVKKYGCFAHDTAKRSNTFVQAALAVPPDPKAIRRTRDDAVNDTATLWLSIIYRALGPEESLKRFGIPSPVKEIGQGWFC